MPKILFSQHNILFFFSAILLIVAPLFRAGNRPIPVMVLELLGVFILLWVLWNRENRIVIPKSLYGFVLALFLTPVTYLLLFPVGFIENLPSRELYHSVLKWIENNGIEGSQYSTLSIVPYETYASFFRLIPPIAIFMAALCLPVKKLMWLCYIFLFMAFMEALLGIAQYLSQNDLFYLGMNYSNFAQGTYPNRNHFAALLEMAIPMVVVLALVELSKRLRHSFRIKKMNMLFIYLLVVAVLLLAAILSHSRTGIFLAFLSMMTTIFIFRNLFSKIYKRFVVGVIVLIPLAVMLSGSGISLINRFITDSPLEGGRAVIFKQTIQGISEFFPVGSGPGTFSYIYRAFQPIDQTHHIRHAHNDYLEIIFETGMIGLVLLTIFFLFFVLRWKKLLKFEKRAFTYVQYGAGIGMTALLLHGLVDFNFHIPANVIYFSLLAGVFFHRMEETAELIITTSSTSSPKHKRKKRRIKPKTDDITQAASKEKLHIEVVNTNKSPWDI